MRSLLILFFFTTGCVGLRHGCTDTYYIDSIGGCDGKGLCGVTAVSRKGNRIKTLKEYPVLSEQVCSQ